MTSDSNDTNLGFLWSTSPVANTQCRDEKEAVVMRAVENCVDWLFARDFQVRKGIQEWGYTIHQEESI